MGGLRPKVRRRFDREPRVRLTQLSRSTRARPKARRPTTTPPLGTPTDCRPKRLRGAARIPVLARRPAPNHHGDSSTAVVITLPVVTARSGLAASLISKRRIRSAQF